MAGQMKDTTSFPKSINEYILQFPPRVRIILRNLRKVIKGAAPEAVEKISYRIPAFYQDGDLVYFAAFKNHIGFYPTSSGIRAFKKELSKYISGKGSVQFPIDKPLPFRLVKRIVRFRVAENSKP